jgi:hypothetical protein
MYDSDSVERLIDLLWDGTPDCMGGTPDLFAPQCRVHEPCDDPWGCWEERVKWAVQAVRSTVVQPAPAEGGPDDGHTFRLTALIRGSYGVVGEEHHTDVGEFMGPAFGVEVRAWNLPDALRKAAELPLADWVHPDA